MGGAFSRKEKTVLGVPMREMIRLANKLGAKGMHALVHELQKHKMPQGEQIMAAVIFSRLFHGKYKDDEWSILPSAVSEQMRTRFRAVRTTLTTTAARARTVAHHLSAARPLRALRTGLSTRVKGRNR